MGSILIHLGLLPLLFPLGELCIIAVPDQNGTSECKWQLSVRLTFAASTRHPPGSATSVAAEVPNSALLA